VAKVFGGGELGRKLAKYIVALENDVPDAKLEMPDDEKPDPKSVKVTPKRRVAKRVRKSKLDAVDKPLQENEIKGEKEQESSQEESSLVKPGQTDFAPISPMLPISPISRNAASAASESQPLPDLACGDSRPEPRPF